LLRIDDPAIRSIMQSVIVERDKLKSQLTLLKSKSQIVVDQRPLGANIAPGDSDVPILEIGAQLTDSERDALRSAIAKDFLADQGWSVGPDGEIVTDRNRVIYDPGYESAIKKILAK
ncbi:MAG: gamma-mobile-trio protein GmtX, partial [Comamonas sp.]